MHNHITKKGIIQYDHNYNPNFLNDYNRLGLPQKYKGSCSLLKKNDNWAHKKLKPHASIVASGCKSMVNGGTQLDIRIDKFKDQNLTHLIQNFKIKLNFFLNLKF